MSKLAICAWSLHRELSRRSEGDTRKIKLTEFPRICSHEFGVNAVELMQVHFPSSDEEYLQELKKSLDDNGVKVVNLQFDRGHASESDPERRKRVFNDIVRWFEIAKYLGARSIRVNTGRGEEEATLQRAIKGYKELVKTAEKTQVKLLIENHGGISNNPDLVSRIINEVGSDYLRTCPDFGNFPPEIDRYKALEKLAEYAFLVHAKTFRFDEKGEESRIDIKRCIDIFKDKGYDSYYSVEFSGPGDQRIGVKKTINLLKKYI